MQTKQRFRHDKSIAPQRIKTLSGHSDWVRALTLLSDGRLLTNARDIPVLASGSLDKTIKLWNVSSGECERTLSGHSDSIRALTLLSDGRLASASDDETIKLWNVLSGACERTLSGHSYTIRALTLLSDGRLASGSADKTIKLWNVKSGTCESTLSGHSSSVRALTLLSDGRLASGSYEEIKLWNVLSGSCEVTLSGHSSWVFALTLLSDGRLASGSEDKTIKLWNVSSGLCERTLSGHGDGVWSLTLLSDGCLASGSWDKTIRVWDVSAKNGIERSTTETCLHILRTADRITSLAMLADGTLASGLENGTIKHWDVGSRPVLTARKIRDNMGLRKRERAMVTHVHERSIIKSLINLWYNIDGTSTWVHHLREHYKMRARSLPHALKATVAGNDTLKFDDYFVNLALTKDLYHQNEETQLFSDTRMALDCGELYERLFEEELTFPMEELFSQLNNRNINTGWVRIIGRAGTGKTTLVQYLAHRWSKKEPLWDNRFDVIFQVKLNLIGSLNFSVENRNAADDLVALILLGLGRTTQFSHAIILQYLKNHSDRVLILLDGFDEIESRWKEPRVQQLIQYAFTLKNGILTSRPIQFPEEWIAQNPFMQSVENIGLSEENVCEYVKKYFGADNTIAPSLISALERNHTMMRLAQIPVNINALCAIWQENEGQPLLTVTMLYHRVVLAVLRHHAVKKDPNAKKPQLAEEYLRRTYEAQLKQLAELAYQAFEAKQTQTLSAELLANFFRAQFDNLTFFREELGILREAEMHSNREGYSPHYFIHLTYQEYFTALHMVQPLIVPEQESAAEKKLRLTLIQDNAKTIRNRLHEDRYRIVWTFLAGLIGIPPYRAGADYYWDALLLAPEKDHGIEAGIIGLHPDTAVLSTYHATLREGLLIAKEVNKPLPERLLPLQHRMQALLQWHILCEDHVLHSMGDAEMESSADIARQTKRHERRQRQLIYDLAQLGAEPLPRLPWDRILGSELVSPLQSSLDNLMALPAASLQDLDNADSRIRYGAVADLLYRAEFKSITRLTSILQHDPCSSLRATALAALSMQQYFHAGELDFLYVALMDTNEDVRRNAALMLGILYNGEEKTIVALRTQLQHDTNAWPRVMIAKILISLADDKSLFKLLANELQHIDTNVRQEVMGFLKEKAAQFSELEILQALLNATAADIALDRAIALRRVPLKTYALLDFNVISNEHLAVLVESIWYHSACAIIQGDNFYLAEKNITLSREKKLALQQAQDRFFSQLNTGNGIHEVVIDLTKRLDLSLKTRVFENDFTDIPLPLPPVDPLLMLTQKMDIILQNTSYFHRDMENLRTKMQSTQAEIQELSRRQVLNEDDVKNLNSRSIVLQQTMTQQREELEAYAVAVEIETKLKQQPLPAPVTEESARYARTFRLMLIRTQLAAAVIGTGLFKTNASTTTGKVGRVLSAFGSSAPLGIGIGIKLISYCCQAADELLVKKRMERLEALGDTSEQVAQLADSISRRLFECPHIENRVKTHHLSQLFSAVADVAQASEEGGFYGALTAVVDSAIDQAITESVTEAEERAEQDANLLLAAIAHQGMPMKNSLPDPHRLFLYAIPLITIVDDVYMRTLMRFTNNLPMQQLDINPRKKAKFYDALTQSWHERAELVVNAITQKRNEFVENVAEQLSSQGLFYWKENSNTMTGKRHVSWRQIEMISNTIDEVTAVALNAL